MNAETIKAEAGNAEATRAQAMPPAPSRLEDRHRGPAAVGRLAIALLWASAVPLLLAACSRPAPVVEDVRPVKAQVVSATAARGSAELAGEVRPRIESRVGFQVGGRIATRSVELGRLVRAGDLLATLDASDYRLGASASLAQLEAARIDRDQNVADYRRYEDLFHKGFISGSELDRRKASLDAAEARFAQAQAQARVSENQAAYATLRAPVPGIVTAIDAEAGQVVAAGQGVVRIAQTSEKEVDVNLPESRLAELSRIRDVDVTLWAGTRMRGRVREIAPLADPATRTYLARIALVDPPPEVAFGMSATVLFAPQDAPKVVAVPLQAVFRDGDGSAVWRVERSTMTVHRALVEVGGILDNSLQLRSGIAPGETIVVAGAHLLREGQKVRLLDEVTQPAAPATPATAAGLPKA